MKTISLNIFHFNPKKELARPLSNYNKVAEVREQHPELLFYKVSREPGNVQFYLKSCLKDKQRILGFNNHGEALNPTQVQPNQKESLFKIISYHSLY